MNIEAARPAIDLSRNAWVREHGDIRLHGTWLYDAELDDTQPALVLVPAHRRVGFRPFVVPLASAYLYTDPRHLALASMNAARSLGFGDTAMSTANRIGGLIYDNLQELIEIPEDPTEAVVGAYGQINDGHQTRTVEILDHVPTKQI